MTIDVSQIGVTPQGFVRPVLGAIITDALTKMVNQLGVAVDQSAQSLIGMTTQILMASIDTVWQGMEGVYDSWDRTKAIGQALDNLGALFGVPRNPATFSFVNLLAVGITGTNIPAGSTATNPDSTVTFVTPSPAILALCTAWAQNQPINLGDVRANFGHVYVAFAAGTTSNSGTGPSSTVGFPTLIQDGSVQWVYVSDGTGFAYIPFTHGNAFGPISGPAYSLSRIGTPIAGWNGVTNPLDALVGSNLEGDDPYRLRQFGQLKGSGSAVASILAAVVDVANVINAWVFENRTDFVDSAGRNPHTVEVLVAGSPATADVARAIQAHIAAGIDTVGSVTNTLADEKGITTVYRYNVPVNVPIYTKLVLYVDPNVFPADGDATAAAGILAFGQTLSVNANVEPSAMAGALFVLAKAGKLPGLRAVVVQVDVNPITGGTPADTPVPISARQQSTWDSSRIAVSHVGGWL